MSVCARPYSPMFTIFVFFRDRRVRNVLDRVCHTGETRERTRKSLREQVPFMLIRDMRSRNVISNTRQWYLTIWNESYMSVTRKYTRTTHRHSIFSHALHIFLETTFPSVSSTSSLSIMWFLSVPFSYERCFIFFLFNNDTEGILRQRNNQLDNQSSPFKVELESAHLSSITQLVETSSPLVAQEKDLSIVCISISS